MHTPVLLNEVIEGLYIKPNDLYIDATVGEGGHAVAMLRKGGRVLGIDADDRQLKRLQDLKAQYPCLTLAHGNFSNIEQIAREHGFNQVDGILFDLGLSWEQLQSLGRGLSFKKYDEALDMRLDITTENTAADYINRSSMSELDELFMRNAEEPASNKLALEIMNTRRTRKINTVSDLVNIIRKVTPDMWEKTATRIFQALRIEVNSEFENLKAGLEGAKNLINKTGRIAVISFHSREDRMVKQFIQKNHLLQITKKAIPGSRDKSFERSAKLRIFSL